MAGSLVSTDVRLFRVPIDSIEWRTKARCKNADPRLFFPDKTNSTRPAKDLCSACTVQKECLEYALVNHERHGIWGGYSERGRRSLNRGN